MKNIALVGHQTIHTYIYLVHFNGCDEAKLKEYAKPWMVTAMEGRDNSAKTDELRVTSVWDNDPEERRRLAEAHGIERVCESADEALDGADGVMVMDEDIDSRTALIEKSLKAGKTVFADKVLAVDPAKTQELIDLAASNGVEVRSWSQLYFESKLQDVRKAEAGGLALCNFRLPNDILPIYGIHLISMMQGAFGSPVKTWRPISHQDHCCGEVTLENGTVAILYSGANIPGSGRVYYNAPDGKEIIASGLDMAGAFEAGAMALIDLFAGREADGPGPNQMIEASRLLEQMVKDQESAPVIEF